MKKRIVYDTADGETFATATEAKKHLNRCYDRELTKLTNEIRKTRDGKHGDLINWIALNHNKFRVLDEIQFDYPCNECARVMFDHYRK